MNSEIVPLLADEWGLAARIQGRERYYALMFDQIEDGRVRIIKRDHDETILAGDRFPWQFDRKYDVGLQVNGNEIEAYVDGRQIFAVRDTHDLPLSGGGVGLVVDTGSISTQAVNVTSL